MNLKNYENFCKTTAVSRGVLKMKRNISGFTK